MELNPEIIAALEIIANGTIIKYLTKHRVEINGIVIHCRFVTNGTRADDEYRYAFNINPNTLTAQYELWVCGTSKWYYLIPIDVIKEIYNDPDVYVNNHPQELMRTMNIVTADDIVIFGKNAKKKEFRQYWNATL